MVDLNVSLLFFSCLEQSRRARASLRITCVRAAVPGAAGSDLSANAVLCFVLRSDRDFCGGARGGESVRREERAVRRHEQQGQTVRHGRFLPLHSASLKAVFLSPPPPAAAVPVLHIFFVTLL